MDNTNISMSKTLNSFVNSDFTYCFTFSDGPENRRMEGEERGGRSRGSASGNRNGDGGGGATVPEGGGEWSLASFHNRT